MNCILLKIGIVYLLRADGCFYLVKIISFVPFLSVTLFKVINTLWQKLFLREACLNPIGEMLNFIYSEALNHPMFVLSWLIPVNYMFLYAKKKKSARPKSTWELVILHVLGNLSILPNLGMFFKYQT